MKHIYVLEICYEDMEIIFTKTEKLLWDLIPHSPEAFQMLCDTFPDYEVFEVNENLMRFHSDRKQIMCPN